jgi:uncharacterized protein YkwD
MPVRPRVKLLSLAALLVLSTLGVLYIRPASAANYTDRVIELTNLQRRRIMGRWCPRLSANDALTAAAQQHANAMASNNFFSHTSLNGASPWDRVRQNGYTARRAAENIAAGATTPEELVNMWMNSPAHRANILNCRLLAIGVGMAYSDNTTYGWYWVEDMGSRR